MSTAIKAFIQNEAGSRVKNKHNEKTLEHIGSATLDTPYPYPYGFILATTSYDGDNLDCYVITQRKMSANTVIDCEPGGILEVFENGDPDHKVIVTPIGEQSDSLHSVLDELRQFIERPRGPGSATHFRIGRFLPDDVAREIIERSRDDDGSAT